jgi:hypothetical protein
MKIDIEEYKINLLKLVAEHDIRHSLSNRIKLKLKT